MGRIRSIRPDFPQSHSMCDVSRDARLTFIMLWTIADDDGRLRGDPRMLASTLFPLDEDSPRLIRGWIEELARVQCVRCYEVAGQAYIDIPNWRVHQKIDKPTPSRLPQFVESSASAPLPVVESSHGEGIGREGRGKNSLSLNLATKLSVERERIEILNNSSTRAFNAPETEQKPLSGSDPQVLDFVAEARRLKAEQEARNAQAPISPDDARWLEKNQDLDPEVLRSLKVDDLCTVCQKTEMEHFFTSGVINCGIFRPATSLDSTTSHVDKSHSGTEPAEIEPKSQNKIAQNCPESDVCDMQAATPPEKSQTGQAPQKACEDGAQELPLDTSEDIIGEVMPPDEAVPVYPRDVWVRRILAAHPRSNTGFRVEQACMAAVEREWETGKHASEHAAAHWIEQRTALYADAVKTWPKGEERFVLAALNFFERSTYADDPMTWRKDAPATADERRQATNDASARAVIQQLRQSGGDHHRLQAPGGPARQDAVAREPQSVRPSLGGFATGGNRAGFR